MSDILLDFVVQAPREAVFAALATPGALERWWTLRSSGRLEVGAEWTLFFGEAYDWRAVVRTWRPGESFALEITAADAEWTGTTVRFDLHERDGLTGVRFAHSGWPDASTHFRVSSYCWAMYLRLLRRWVELGETVPYDQRLEA